MTHRVGEGSCRAGEDTWTFNSRLGELTGFGEMNVLIVGFGGSGVRGRLNGRSSRKTTGDVGVC